MIRFAVLGLGNIAHRFARSIAHVDNGVIGLACSHSTEKRALFKDMYHVEGVLDDYEAALKNPNIQASYIALPHGMHEEWIEKSIMAHKAVLCEKPMCLDYESTKRILALAKQENVLVLEALKGYFLPGTVELKKQLDQHIIGELKTIEASFESNVPYIEGKYLYDEGQGGAWNDVGIYPLSFVLSIVDSEVDTIETTVIKSEYANVDGKTDVKITFKNGVVAIIHAAINYQSSNVATIVGSDGVLKVPYYYRPTSYTKIMDGLFEEVALPTLADDMSGEIAGFIEALNQGSIETVAYNHEAMLKNAYYMDEIRRQIHEALCR